MSDTDKNIKIAAAISCAIINFHPYTSINNEYTATDIINHFSSITNKQNKNQIGIILGDLEDAFSSKAIRKHFTKNLFPNQVAFYRRANS